MTSNLADENITVTGQTITFTANEPIPNGLPFEVEANFPHGLLDVAVREWQRDYDGESLRVDVDNFQSDLTINGDGTLSVHEETHISILEGALHQGFRSLNLLNIDKVEEPSVIVNGQPLTAGEGDCSGCYVINTLPRAENWVFLDTETEQLTINENNGGVYNVDWYTRLPVQVGESVTTTFDYQVKGALRVNTENQLLTWQVVPDYGQSIRQAALRLTLPPGVTPDQITLEGPDEQGKPQLQSDGSLLFRFDGPVAPGAWQFALTLPANATNAQPSKWQQQFEDVIAQADAAAVTRARNALMRRIVGILAIIAAILGAIIAWFRWGRRKVKETMGGYISTPPSHQSPALVSYLVDHKVSERGVLGSIFYLASFKVLEIELEGEIKLRRLYNEPLQSTSRLTDVYGETIPIPRHLQALFDQVLLPGLPHNQWAPLDSISPPLRTTLPEIYASLASDLQKFYIHVPGSRGETIPGVAWFVVYATLLGLMFTGVIPWFVGFAIGFVALLIFVAWSALHETGQGGYSDEGALEADRWRRFKTYLQDIKKYGDLAAAQQIIDRYFGYAVALGVENVVLAQAVELGSLRPIWMPTNESLSTLNRPDEPLRPSHNTSSGGSGFPWTSPRPSIPRVQPERPTLAGMSAQIGDSLRQASSSLGSMLSTTAGDADSAARTVVVNSQLRRREMEWKPNTPVSSVLDDILRQSVADAREIQAREVARRIADRNTSRSTSESGGEWNSSSNNSSSSSSRSSGGFGRSSSSSSSSSRSSSSSGSSRSSSSSSSRSGGGGRSGFR